MQSLQLDDLELVEGWSDDDPKLRGRFDFPVHAETGAASTSVVYFEVPPGSHCGRHTHSAEEILLILDGSVEAEVECERGRLVAGGIALIPPSLRTTSTTSVGCHTGRWESFPVPPW